MYFLWQRLISDFPIWNIHNITLTLVRDGYIYHFNMHNITWSSLRVNFKFNEKWINHLKVFLINWLCKRSAYSLVNCNTVRTSNKVDCILIVKESTTIDIRQTIPFYLFVLQRINMLRYLTICVPNVHTRCCYSGYNVIWVMHSFVYSPCNNCQILLKLVSHLSGKWNFRLFLQICCCLFCLRALYVSVQIFSSILSFVLCFFQTLTFPLDDHVPDFEYIYHIIDAQTFQQIQLYLEYY